MMGRAASTREVSETKEYVPLHITLSGIFAVCGHAEQFFPTLLLGNTQVKVTGKERAPTPALLGCFHGLENSRVPLVPNRGNGGKKRAESFKCWSTTKQNKSFHWKQNGFIPGFAYKLCSIFFSVSDKKLCCISTAHILTFPCKSLPFSACLPFDYIHHSKSIWRYYLFVNVNVSGCYRKALSKGEIWPSGKTCTRAMLLLSI